MRALAAGVAAFFISVTSLAAAEGPDESLVGTWVMTDTIGQSWTGSKITAGSFETFQLEITEHDGPIFAGKLRWRLTHDQHQLDDGEGETAASEETVFAVRDFDGVYVVVEHPDQSIHRLKIVDADTLEMMSYETGPGAAVGFATFRRR